MPGIRALHIYTKSVSKICFPREETKFPRRFHLLSKRWLITCCRYSQVAVYFCRIFFGRTNLGSNLVAALASLKMNDFPHLFSGSDSLASVLAKPLSGLVVPATDSGSCPRTGTDRSRCNRKWDQSESSPMSPFLWLAGTPTWIQREGRQGPTFKAGRSGNLANVRLLAKPLPSLLCNRNSIDETEEYGISVKVLYHFLSLSSLTRIVFVSELWNINLEQNNTWPQNLKVDYQAQQCNSNPQI